MKKVSEKASKKAKDNDKGFKPVEFDEGAKGDKQIAAFRRKCENPKFVAKCLLEYQNWRRGMGRYEYHVVPKKNAPMPFCSLALGIIEDAAIKFLMYYDEAVRNGKIINPDGTIR